MNLPESDERFRNDMDMENKVEREKNSIRTEQDAKQDWIDIQLDEEEAGKKAGKHEDKQSLLILLLGAVLLMLVAIFILLLVQGIRKPSASKDSSEALQQSITDYASMQKQQDNIEANNPGMIEDADSGGQSLEPAAETVEEMTENAGDTEEEPTVEYDPEDKTAIVVDVEDESDPSYSKEFILNEMEPYFAANNLEAVWDLAHLKRYVKLSAQLKDTNSYYYKGEVDEKGVPDGIGLAIYEDNTYYYGSWSHGMRSGDGRWYRFYIDEIGYRTKKKKYQAHSYSGQWSYDLPNGEGAEHYDVDVSQLAAYERIIQNVVGNFTDGLYDGEMFANTINYQGTVEEWYGNADKGVFRLWRDMSSIGECSVWQNRLEQDIYMDIFQSDNKNQGMRELLNLKAEK